MKGAARECGLAAAVAGLYFLGAKLGLSLIAQPEGFAALWPPSGLLLGALLLLRPASWPLTLSAVFGAVTWANLSGGNGLALSLGFAVANCTESAAAAWLVRRLLGRPPALGRVRDVLALAGGAAVGTNALTALLGAAVVHWGTGAAFWPSWRLWWIEDGVGMLVVAPLVLAAGSLGREIRGVARGLEEAAAFAGLSAAAWWVFLSRGPAGIGVSPNPYMVFPFLLLAALRYGPGTAALGNLVVAGAAVWGTAVDAGYFGRLPASAGNDLLSAQVYVAISSFSALVVAALYAERLEAAEALRRSGLLLNQTQRISHVGGWEYDPASGKGSWTEEVYRIHGLPLDYRHDPHRGLAFYAPGDRPKIEQAFRRLVEEGEPYDLELEFVDAGGGRKWMRTAGQAERVAGKTVRVFGHLTDVTDRRRAREELERLYEQKARDAEEKSRLLDEVNHRVKNNLVSILGLLLAEKSGAPEPCRRWVEPALERLSGRVRALLAAHELLSDSQWVPVSVGELAARVVERSSAGGAAGRLRADVEAGPAPVTVSPRQAATLALVLNELAVNTLNHAAPGRGELRAAVSARSEGDRLVVEYRDDGAGYPEEILAGARPGEGLRLIEELVAGTLRGELALTNRGGAAATVRIRSEEPGRT